MTTHDPNPTKRVPKSLGTESKLFGTYTLADAVVALLPGVFVVLVVQTVVPAVRIAGISIHAITIPLALLAIALGALFVTLTPSYTTSVDWLLTVFRFHRTTRTFDHDTARAETHVERLHPRADAVERTDGAFVALVQVSPPPMALATDNEWARKAQSFQNFLDTVAEFPLQFFSTTRPFPVDSMLAHYERRLEDADVRANPRLARLIDSYLEWYETDRDVRTVTVRDHYVVVSVVPDDIQFDAGTTLERLADLPMIGFVLDVLFAPSIEEQRARALSLLEERVTRVESGLRDLDGCDASPVSTTDAVDLLATYWTGVTRPADERPEAIRTRPLVAPSSSGGHA
ncbi:hypothetical protein GCM10009037_17270 [Halarchaeum grantii]|uniref:PrgI family protein n=1 Tax=Halarchaeum grantii TaxID=1193105 RepID=A0A830F2X8_9EURY|nr:hypothetical protein [Halarchaeum grantii]GGL34202.1 hypothetical protein GCM10009037_17270 [Halarchaeum grantii]